MLLIPHLKRTLVGRNNLGVGFIYRHSLGCTFCEQRLFIAENNRANAGKPRLNVVNLGLHLVRIWREGFIHQRTRAYDRHITKEDIEYLGKFVYLRLPEEASERQNARIALCRVQPARHIGAVAEHSRELQYLEVLVLVANTILSVEDVMLAGTFENDNDRHKQWRQDDDCNARENDIEEAFEEFVHIRGLSSCVLDRINRILQDSRHRGHKGHRDVFVIFVFFVAKCSTLYKTL